MKVNEDKISEPETRFPGQFYLHNTADEKEEIIFHERMSQQQKRFTVDSYEHLEGYRNMNSKGFLGYNKLELTKVSKNKNW